MTIEGKEGIYQFVIPPGFEQLAAAISEVWPAWERAIRESGLFDAVEALEKFALDVRPLLIEQDEEQPKYDPGNAVSMWKQPKRHKRPYKQVRYNQVSAPVIRRSKR